MTDRDREPSLSILCIDALSDRDYYQKIKKMISTSKGSINIQINDNHKSTPELNEQAERSALNQIKSQDDPPDIAVLLLSPDYYNSCTAFHAEIIKRYKKDEIVVLGIAIAACDFEDTGTIPILFKDHPLGEREITDASYQEIVNKINVAIDHVLKKRKLASLTSIATGQTDTGSWPIPPLVQPLPTPNQGGLPHVFIHFFRNMYEKTPVLYRYLSICIVALLVGGLVGYQLHPQATSSSVPNTPASLLRAPAHVLLVTSDQDSGPGTLRDQVERAHDGDVISFAPSVKDVVLKSPLEITKSISVWGDSSHAPTLFDQATSTRRDKGSHPVTIESGTGSAKIDVLPKLYVTLSNLTFLGDNIPLDNAFIMNSGDENTIGSGELLLIDCDISQFESDYNGSFISNIGGNVEIRNSYFSNNSSHGDGGGAIYNLRGKLTLDHSTFTQNSTDYSGGAIYNVNGEVSVLNNSWLDLNQVIGNNIDVGGGGGAINSSNGSLIISNSSLNDNTSFGDGGALLLNGTTAQIIGSHIRTNKANGTKGGGIAVESNPDNNGHSTLSLFSSDVSNNTVSGQDKSSPEANIDGKTVSTADKQIVQTSPDVVKTSNSYNPVNNPERLTTLTVQDFRKFCASLNHMFTDATVGVDLNTTKCIAHNSDQGKSFNQLHVSVRDVCVALMTTKLQHGEDPKLIIDRLASYWDPLSWQCFKNEVKLGNITQGIVARQTNPQQEVPLDIYCRQKFNPEASAYLLPHANKNPTAYDIKCKDPSNSLFRINMAEACSIVYGNNKAVDRLDNFKDPDSWECLGPKNS